MQASLMWRDHQPEETKHCKATETGGVRGTQRMLLSNKLNIWQKKNYVPLCPLGILRGYLALCFPTPLFKGLIHPFPSCSHKCILSHTTFSVLKMCCISSTRASSRASICSIPTLIQLPPGWHSPKSYGRRWAWQPGAQLGAFHWEPANISLNPFFPLCSPVPTATVKSLLIMPFAWPTYLRIAVSGTG